MSDNDDEETQDDEVEPEGLQEGDFIKLDYTATVSGDDGDEDERVIDTTDAEVAEEEGLETEDREFGPRTIILGEGHLFDEVEDEIVGKDVGYSNTVTVAAEDAFGEHDPDDVETVSAKKISEDDRYPGAQVQLDGRQGYVETIIGGRARVDFNHPLAGKDVTYDFEVVGEVDDVVEQAEGLIDLYVGAEVEVSTGTETKTETTVEEDDEGEEVEKEEEVEIDVLYIESTPELSMNQNWMFTKNQLAHDLMHRFDVDRVVVRETFDDEEFHGGMGMGGGGDIEELGLEDVEDLDEEDIEELVEEGEVEAEE